jgi:hypothetical protein
MTYNPSNHKKWQAMGRKLNRPGYRDLPESELEAKKRIAEKWLKENPTHPKYQEALRRYEKVCDELNRACETEKNVRETLL